MEAFRIDIRKSAKLMVSRPVHVDLPTMMPSCGVGRFTVGGLRKISGQWDGAGIGVPRAMP